MARPIEATPPLDAEDWSRLVRELEDVCTPEEAERRIAWARRELARMMIDPEDPSP